MPYIKPVKEETLHTLERMRILTLHNGKAICIDGREFTRDEAHEIIISLTKTWGTDFEKQELKDMALGIDK